MENFKQLKLSSNRCPVEIFVGSKELKVMLSSASYVYRNWLGKKTKHILPGAGHDISKPVYYGPVFKKIKENKKKFDSSFAQIT